MNRTATLRMNASTQKWEAVIEYRGSEVVVGKSDNVEYLKKCIDARSGKKINAYHVTSWTMGETAVATPVRAAAVAEEAPAAEMHFSVKTRYKIMSNVIRMVVTGHAKSGILTGGGGLGKTHQTLKEIEAAGLKGAVMNDEGFVIGDDHDYVIIKGNATARGIYEVMYNNRDRLIIFDDCRKALEDKTANELLKAALDSYSERLIAWPKSGGTRIPVTSDSDEEGSEKKIYAIPDQFMFTGRVMFITNVPMNKLDQALRTRSQTVDLSMTKAEIVERLEEIHRDVAPEISVGVKRMALDFIKQHTDVSKNLSIRSLINVSNIIRAFPDDWQDTALYTLVTGE